MRHLTLALAASALCLLGLASQAQAQCDPNYPELCDLEVTSQIEQPDLAYAVDIVFVGDGFTDQESWRQSALAMIATIREQTLSYIYPAVPEVFNFHIVDVISQTNEVTDEDTDDTALGMRASGSGFISVNQYKAGLAAANAPDVDVVFAIANTNGGRANANYPSALATGGSVRMSNNTSAATHELGHAIVRLADEYLEESNCRENNEGQLADLRNVTQEPTCQKYTTTPGTTCEEGNHYCRRGKYRAAQQCLMRSNGDVEPCPVCRRAMEDMLLQRRTGQDSAEPWAAFSAPSQGQVISGLAQLQIQAFDTYRWPVTVALEVDGAYRDQLSLSSGSGSLSLNTRSLPDGPHSLSLHITDEAGHSRGAHSIEVLVQNQTALGAPEVQLVIPRPGATVSGQVSLSAQALKDGAGATDTELMAAWIDGELVGALPVSFLSLSWDSTQVEPGLHHLEITARDHSQNVGSTGLVPLTVQAEQGRAVFPSLTEPSDWSVVGASFLLRLSAQNLRPEDEVSLLLDGQPLEPNPLGGLALPSGGRVSGLGVLVNSEAWPMGPHQLTLVVRTQESTFRSSPLALVRQAPEHLEAFLVQEDLYVDQQARSQVAAAGPSPITSIQLEVTGHGVVGSLPAAAGALGWDASALPEGCYGARALATDEQGQQATSSDVELCVSHSAPSVQISNLEEGQALAAGAQVVQVDVAHSPQVSVPTQVTLWVDGEVAATQQVYGGRGALALALAPGARTLVARGVDELGREAMSAPLHLVAQDCQQDSDCEDSDACTVDRCAPSGLCLHIQQGNCCTQDSDCDDADSCTSDACVQGQCQRQAIEGCCNHHGQCQGEDACQLGRCQENRCTQSSNPACCTQDSGCDDGDACTADSCGPEGLCLHQRQPGCCAQDSDCDDGDPCTADSCLGDSCGHEPIPGCCFNNLGCDDGDVCTYDQCIDNLCQNPPNPFCCQEDADCATANPCESAACDQRSNRCQRTSQPGCCTFDSECADFNACTEDRCQDGQCVYEDGCCQQNSDCDDDNACTVDICRGGVCLGEPIPGCCAQDSDCDDNNACTVDSCQGDTCAFEAVPGCCASDEQCDDFNPCTDDACVDNTCQATPRPGCCLGDRDCDDDNACTADRCRGNACVREGVPGCCAQDTDCDDGDPCTADSCLGDTCAFEAVPGCCLVPEDCGGGDACTQWLCEDNSCQAQPREGCCVEDDDCEDGNACTFDLCRGGRCSFEANRNCCITDLDCRDQDACTQGVCQDNICRLATNPECCLTDAQCNDNNPCTDDACVGNTCLNQENNLCCLEDGDCDDGDICSRDFCQDNLCSRERIQGCCRIDDDCEDRDVCTSNTCFQNQCQSAQVVGCCNRDSDCDDGDACTVDSCVDNRCQSDASGPCCTRDEDCDDGDACTADACVDNSCRSSPRQGCCVEDADCDDGDVCTVDSCLDNACQHTPSRSCCQRDSDCNDGDACTVDACVDNRCLATALPGCCTRDADCDDGDACTLDACVGGACEQTPRPGCCAVDADCDDGNACTTNSCDRGACLVDPIPGCCLSDAQCDDGDPCTLDECVNTACVWTPDLACGQDMGQVDMDQVDMGQAPDQGEDLAGDSGAPQVKTRGGGGGCAQAPGEPGGSWWWLLGMFLWSARRR